MLQWVRLNKYCELSGETRDTIKHKRRTGLWMKGREYRVAEDGKLWINLPAVNKWAEGKKRTPKR